MKTLFERVFSGNDEMYALAVKAVDEALAKLGPEIGRASCRERVWYLV